MANIGVFFARSKFPLLLLAYPAFAWLLLAIYSSSISQPGPLDAFAARLMAAVYVVVGIDFSFLIAVPLCSARYRNHPHKHAKAFRSGFYTAAILLGTILPVHGILVALSLYVVDPEELWFWGIFSAGGSVCATFVLLMSGIFKTPRIYVTLRALPIRLEEHPKLEELLLDLSKIHGVALPAHILVGLQPDLLTAAGTVFCPEGRLDGGAICFSSPTCSVLSSAEFRSLTGEALVELQSSVNEKREELLSTTQTARDVLKDLDESMREWSWFPKWGLHPSFTSYEVRTSGFNAVSSVSRKGMAGFFRGGILAKPPWSRR
jgi:hypothetical protein